MMIFGHRGASKLAPENTLASIRKAFELNADGVEVDIHITKNKKLVVIHDDTLLRTAGKDVNVETVDYEEIKSADVGSFFDKQYADEHPPLLKDVIDIIPSGKYMQVEVKGDLPIDILLDDLRNSEKGLSEFIIISFNLDVLKRIKKAEPEILTLWINGEYSEQNKTMLNLDEIRRVVALKEIDGLAFDSRFNITKDYIEELRENGLGILFAWTVDNYTRADELNGLGVDAIATNDLETMLKGNFNK